MIAPRVVPVMLALLVTGCSSTGPDAVPDPSPSHTPAPSLAAPPDPSAGLRPCLGPWAGRGAFETVWPFGIEKPQDVPVVNVTEPDIVVAVWLDAEPAYEGEAVFTPTDFEDGPFADRSRIVHINLTGDPAYGTGNLTAGSYDFTFQPEHGVVGRHAAEWTVDIREVPHLGAPNCRPADQEGQADPAMERLHALHAKPEEGGPSAAALPENG